MIGKLKATLLRLRFKEFENAEMQKIRLKTEDNQEQKQKTWYVKNCKGILAAVCDSLQPPSSLFLFAVKFYVSVGSTGVYCTHSCWEKVKISCTLLEA